MKKYYIFNEESIAADYGIGTYIREVSNTVKEFVDEINVIQLRSDKTKFVIEKKAGINYYYFPTFKITPLNPTQNNIEYYKGVFKVLRMYIDAGDKMTFHLNYHLSNVLVEQIKRHYPTSKVILTVHSLDWAFLLEGDVAKFKRIANLDNEPEENQVEKIVYRDYKKGQSSFNKVDSIICLSNSTYELLKTTYGIHGSKITMIQNGLSDSFIPLDDNKKSSIRKHFGLQADEKIFLYAGRLEKTKGILYLIEAFNIILKSHPNCKLIIAGDGELYNECVKKCNPNWSKIIFTGRVEQKDLYQLYQIADVGIISSLHEQCSYVAIEMMMFNMQIIATDGYGVSDMFIDKYNALVTKIGEEKLFIRNLANTIIHTINLPTSTKMRKNARMSYLKLYTLEAMHTKMKKLFSTLMC